ncbi:hypothetical protein FGO68_gene7614 [Halteria grandinella]|uniref:Uncharacterized protein n=1 Tax=Halteria grandinella TaxID=5974 RepID=A0A8J8NI44_HALGN|nr:hypothetical protein FGO68_gene7614 [Halteria grandinella]
MGNVFSDGEDSSVGFANKSMKNMNFQGDDAGTQKLIFALQKGYEHDPSILSKIRASLNEEPLLSIVEDFEIQYPTEDNLNEVIDNFYNKLNGEQAKQLLTHVKGLE